MICHLNFLNADQTGNLTDTFLLSSSSWRSIVVSMTLRNLKKSLRLPAPKLPSCALSGIDLSADGSSSLADACALLLFFTAFSYGTYDSIFTQICQEANSRSRRCSSCCLYLLLFLFSLFLSFLTISKKARAQRFQVKFSSIFFALSSSSSADGYGAHIHSSISLSLSHIL